MTVPGKGWCTERFRLALFAAYVAAIVSALANPANLNYERAYLLTQGANVATLLVLSYCKGGGGADALAAAWLGVAFVMRATGQWRGGSRWDSLLVTVGMLLILQHAFYQVVPRRVPHRALVYLAFSCLIMPVLSALPHLVRMPAADRPMVRRALGFSRDAYALSSQAAGQGLLGPLWTLRDADTDTSAGVTRVVDARTELYVYFAGTESAENWKTNIDIKGDVVPQEWGCASPGIMRTHKGYTTAFASVASKMLTALEEELQRVGATDDLRIVFCGHSLGGALATMAAMYACCKMPRIRPNVVVITFGAPQVGDANFVKSFDAIVPSCVRVVNPMDPVPRLLQAQYVHVKGYYPVGSLKWDNVFKPHNLSTYAKAIDMPRAASIMCSFVPAVVVAILIGMYITWQLRT